MKKLENIAENETEERALQLLVRDIRNFTTDSLSGLSLMHSRNISDNDRQNNLNIQKKIYNNMFELFERMHRIVDYPSYVILEDELRKAYKNKD